MAFPISIHHRPTTPSNIIPESDSESNTKCDAAAKEASVLAQTLRQARLRIAEHFEQRFNTLRHENATVTATPSVEPPPRQLMLASLCVVMPAEQAFEIVRIQNSLSPTI